MTTSGSPSVNTRKSAGKVGAPASATTRVDAIPVRVPTAPVAPQDVTLTHERIGERAKAIWQQKGCPSGRDEENWYEAIAQLATEI